MMKIQQIYNSILILIVLRLIIRNQFMLNYSQFQFAESSKSIFKFKKLIPIDQQNGIYVEASTKKRYHISIFTNTNQFSNFQQLYKRNIFGNISGLMKRKNQFYVFATVDNFSTLAQYIEKHVGQKQLISQLFCLQMIQTLIDIGRQFQTVGLTVKIVTPFHIILNQVKNKGYKFQLKYPYAHYLFDGLNHMTVVREIQFTAPEILALMDHEFDLANKSFSKAILYSIGLTLLYCFGYRIKSQQRIQALKKSKEFNIFLKAIRKQIKIFQEGKFISKVIKILMESNEFVRDNMETFLIKLHSPQLQSLRKFVFKSSNSLPKAYLPTIYSEYSQPSHLTSLNRTIEIRGSSPNQKSSQKSDQSENNTYASQLFATFKKSAQSIKYPAQILEVEEQYKIQQDIAKVQIHSPIQIIIDWEDQNYQEELKPTRQEDKQMIQSSKHQYDENRKEQIKPNYKQKQIELKRRYKIDDNKGLDNMTIENESSVNVQHVESISEMEDKLPLPKMKNKQSTEYQVMVEQEEPSIIRYEHQQYKLGSTLKSRKKTSKGSQLQDMTLVEIEAEQDAEDEQLEVEEKNGNYHDELKKQFGKKSEAIFIILLVSFLIYKIIDFIVN